jgi:hypothetical protein
MVPAERPAIVSTSAGERRAWFSFICEIKLLVFAWCYVSGDVMTMLKLEKITFRSFADSGITNRPIMLPNNFS